MKILVTGASGFVGKNLICQLENLGYKNIYKYDKDNSKEDLDLFTKDCDFVFHLAGVNRPKQVEEFVSGNVYFTQELIDSLEKNNNNCRIMMSSSIQAELDNPYGESKRNGEKLIFEYSIRNSVPVFVYRFQNLYGKWSNPNYNSVVATFCYNVANNLPITINDKNAELRLCYIDDVVKELINCLEGNPTADENNFYKVPVDDKVILGRLAEIIQSFKANRKSLNVINCNSHLEKSLYSTYLSFLPTNDFAYELKENVDNRGSFTEIIKTIDSGQFSVNISKPGITKGNHWHNTKTEKFLVVSGHCLIKFRKIGDEKVYTYDVSDKKMEVVDIPCGYTHNITNVGDSDSVTFMWCNECYDPNNPDTYYLEV